MHRPELRSTAETVVMVFGVFDGLHDGHRSFLMQARELGDRLIVVVARDESVMRLKKHAPQFPLSVRMDELAKSNLAHVVTPGDETEGGWEVVLKHGPRIVALGYDQHAMHTHLSRALSSFPFTCEIAVLQPYQPDHLHSSLLNPIRAFDSE